MSSQPDWRNYGLFDLKRPFNLHLDGPDPPWPTGAPPDLDEVGSPSSGPTLVAAPPSGPALVAAPPSDQAEAQPPARRQRHFQRENGTQTAAPSFSSFDEFVPPPPPDPYFDHPAQNFRTPSSALDWPHSPSSSSLSSPSLSSPSLSSPSLSSPSFSSPSSSSSSSSSSTSIPICPDCGEDVFGILLLHRCTFPSLSPAPSALPTPSACPQFVDLPSPLTLDAAVEWLMGPALFDLLARKHEERNRNQGSQLIVSVVRFPWTECEEKSGAPGIVSTQPDTEWVMLHNLIFGMAGDITTVKKYHYQKNNTIYSVKWPPPSEADPSTTKSRRRKVDETVQQMKIEVPLLTPYLAQLHQIHTCFHSVPPELVLQAIERALGRPIRRGKQANQKRARK